MSSSCCTIWFFQVTPIALTNSYLCPIKLLLPDHSFSFPSHWSVYWTQLLLWSHGLHPDVQACGLWGHRPLCGPTNCTTGMLNCPQAADVQYGSKFCYWEISAAKKHQILRRKAAWSLWQEHELADMAAWSSRKTLWLPARASSLL